MEHLEAYRGFGPVAYIANLLFLACLPIAIVLLVTGLWPLGLVAFLVGTPVSWRIRNRAVARATVETEHEGCQNPDSALDLRKSEFTHPSCTSIARQEQETAEPVADP